jgi:hypothetical protein
MVLLPPAATAACGYCCLRLLLPAATATGEALISGYCRMGLDDLWKPDLRGKIEASIRDVAAGRVSKEQVRHHTERSCPPCTCAYLLRAHPLTCTLLSPISPPRPDRASSAVLRRIVPLSSTASAPGRCIMPLSAPTTPP